MTLLPPALRSALAGLSEGRGRHGLAERSSAISVAYKARRNSNTALHDAESAIAYALARMPATYAAVMAALGHLVAAAPELNPESVLDIGCGPGTASFAATETFPDIARLDLLDRNGPFLELARMLAGEVLTTQAVQIAGTELEATQALPGADLVIASYVFAELGQAARLRLLPSLWGASKEALLLVEPGTPDGFSRLREARDLLLLHGAHVAAPCTHASACPMQGDRWCRFLVRVQRSRDHRILKGAERPFEDEPFAYLAVIRNRPEARMSHRIIARPSLSKVSLTLPLCGAAGLEQRSFASRNKKSYKEFKRLEWGDAVEIPIQATLAEHQER